MLAVRVIAMTLDEREATRGLLFGLTFWALVGLAIYLAVTW